MPKRPHAASLLLTGASLLLLPRPVLAQQPAPGEGLPAVAPTPSDPTRTDDPAALPPAMGSVAPGTSAPPPPLPEPSPGPAAVATQVSPTAPTPEAPAGTAGAASAATTSNRLPAVPSPHSTTTAAPPAPEGHRGLGVELAAELGFLSVLHHTVQFSKDGTKIDYVKDAGQNVLFPFVRLGADLFLRERTVIMLVYQPLKLVTQEVAPRDLTIDEEVFTRGTPMTFTYGFPFWRAGISRDVLRSPRHDLWLGGGLQIRNATIEFASSNGEQLVTNRDVGPVPLLRAAGRHTFPSGRFLEGEVDGFYAPIKYINGADADVEGAAVDASVRGGTPVADLGEVFLNVRYFGGGADGTGSDDGPGDGYTSNWLHFLTLTLGARLRAL